MTHKHRHGKRHRHSGHSDPFRPEPEARVFKGAQKPSGDSVELEVVLVSDTAGTLDAVRAVVAGVAVQGVKIRIIHTSVGAVSKSDLQMAATGTRLVVGFNVELNPMVDMEARNKGVEVRLYRVIYRLGSDLEQIARTLMPHEVTEELLGRAKVIALFKSSLRDIILGCDVQKGRIAIGDRFRVVGVAGPVHEGKVDSLHIGSDTVREARSGQEVGLMVYGFQQVRVGDLVEVFRASRGHPEAPWRPRGGVQRVE